MNQRKRLRKLNRIMHRVKKQAKKTAQMSDVELKGLTDVFRQRLAKSKNQDRVLDKILPLAFAAICEADKRVLGKYPYDAQIRGGIALHQGLLGQMNTGEGKTLVATMPLYLNALTGKSTILVTTNEYLALRDAKEMGPVYEFMGLTVAAGVCEHPEDHFTNDEKKEIYGADIVYTTHGTLGFDYLFNNLVTSAEDRFLRDLYYVIIDEADSVLLDSAQTPLVISGSPRVQSNFYELADFFVSTLVEGEDYEVEDKKVWLTDAGIHRAEVFFQIPNFYDTDYFEINRHIILSLRAHALFKKEKEYVVSSKDELILLDTGSGRMMPGVKLRGGQHQAIEAKEHLNPSQENRSVASITYQNLFLLFPKISGMSGTIADAREELLNVYGLQVLVIPPNKPVKRKDLPDLYFQNADTQFEEAIRKVVEVHKTGQPVLIVVSTIAETELVSKILIQEKIPHNVLNANNAFWEADIIKEAGQMNSVTVATSMAGRGTDIKLGEGVSEIGGLAVIGIGRMPNTRQERQARGRSGRQGDPGFSQFFVSLQDEIVSENAPSKYLETKHRLRRGKLKRIINTAQALGEERAVENRKQALDYDMVVQRQREMIYSMRNHLLDGDHVEKKKFLKIAKGNINDFLKEQKDLNQQKLNRYILDNISYCLDEESNKLRSYKKRAVRKYLLKYVESSLQRQKEQLHDENRMEEFMRMAMLHAIDDAWVEQVDYLQQLQAAVSGRSIAQRNPVFEYQNDALDSFRKMEKMIFKNIVRNTLLSNVYVDEKRGLQILLP